MYNILLYKNNYDIMIFDCTYIDHGSEYLLSRKVIFRVRKFGIVSIELNRIISNQEAVFALPDTPYQDY